jgi:hypothetical protein
MPVGLKRSAVRIGLTLELLVLTLGHNDPRGKTMIDHLEPAVNSGASSTPLVGAVVPSCYRISVLSGSLEVSARLKNADDLELLMKVLEANKGLFTRAVPATTEVLARLDRSYTNHLDKVVGHSEANPPAKAHSPQTEVSAKPDRLATKSLAKGPRAETIPSVKADPLDAEVLTLT